MFRLLAAIFILFLLCAPAGRVFAREQAIVKATQNDKYIRLFFYCKQPVNFTTNLSGNSLKISFKNDIDVDASQIAAVSGADISAANFSNNTVAITLAGNGKPLH